MICEVVGHKTYYSKYFDAHVSDKPVAVIFGVEV
jgi:hypothetical protein